MISDSNGGRLKLAAVVALTASAFVSAGAGFSFAQARPRATLSSKPQSYASVDECIISRHIGELPCRTGFANAKAEFEEKVPRFASRQACEAAFNQCSLFFSSQPLSPADQARRGQGPEFTAIMEKFIIVPGKTGRLMVLPSARSSRIRPAFVARPLETADLEISAKRGEAARQTWQAAWLRSTRAPAASYAASGSGAVSVDLTDPQAANATDQPASYPVSARRWNQMQSDIARIKKSNLPTVQK